jgi:RNA polymerase sigma-70 factor, ECF subfamily
LAEELEQGRWQEDDAALIARARTGDGAAIDQLYRSYRDQVYTLCVNLCGDREEAQDLLQETFVRAFRGLPRFAGRAKLSTWLYRITVNLAHELGRRKRALPEAVAISCTTNTVDTVAEVRTVLSQLAPDFRQVLVLRYSQDLSYQEIAECLGWSLPKVKVTIHRAKQAFKAAYRQQDEIL